MRRQGRLRRDCLDPNLVSKRIRTAPTGAEARQSKDESLDLELKMSELSLLKKELFGDPDSAIADIKFYPGESGEHSIDEIAGAIRAAISDVKAGNGADIDLSL